MAKKVKATKKTTARKRSVSSNSYHHHEQDTFLIIVGGGLVVLLLLFMTMSGFSRRDAQQGTEKATAQMQNTKAEEEETVTIKDYTYSPATLTIRVGSTVTFTNEDAVSHNAVADDGSFDTGLLAKGESSSITFSEAGTYTYHSTPHANMNGTIVVEE